MNKICTVILIIGQVLALSAWANAPMTNDHGNDGAHMHLDQHSHNDHTQPEQDHEHDEGCHVHLSVQLFSSSTMIPQAIIKPVQNSHMSHHIGRMLIGPPTPPPAV